MVEKMENIRVILANNIKELRRKCGFSQDRLAEIAGISSQYLATIETCRKFPTPEVLDRLAAALEIETHELFAASASPQMELKKLHNEILADLDRAINEAVGKAIKEQYKFNRNG